ncbi:MAG: glycosyltransferase family 4 protein, partial [Cypionkella sp.]
PPPPPLAIWVQDLWPNALAGTGYVRNPRLLALVERAVRMLYRRADLLLGQSPAFVESIRPMAGSTPVEYLPNPGDAGADDPAPAGRAALSPGFNIVFAGNLGRAQALDTVVEAAEILRPRTDITIWLFGSGALSDELARAVRARGLARVRLPGRVAPEEMGRVLAAADAALLTLVDDAMVARTIPSKLQTYLGAGRPVVVAAGGEAARVTREAGAGVIAPPGDPAALARAIAALADLPAAERAAMGERAARYYAEHFEPDGLARWLIARLRRLARLRTGTGA